jgi:hypothetical protein
VVFDDHWNVVSSWTAPVRHVEGATSRYRQEVLQTDPGDEKLDAAT